MTEDNRRPDEEVTLHPDVRTALTSIRTDRANLQRKSAGKKAQEEVEKIRGVVTRHILAEQGLLHGNYASAAELLREKAAELTPGRTANFLAPLALGRLHVSSRKKQAQGMLSLSDRLLTLQGTPGTPQ